MLVLSNLQVCVCHKHYYQCSIPIYILQCMDCMDSGIPLQYSDKGIYLLVQTLQYNNYNIVKCYVIKLQLRQISKTFESLLSINVVSSYCLIESESIKENAKFHKMSGASCPCIMWYNITLLVIGRMFLALLV